MSVTAALLGAVGVFWPIGAHPARVPAVGMAVFAKGYPHAKIRVADVYQLQHPDRPSTTLVCGHFTARPDRLAQADDNHQFAYFPVDGTLVTEHLYVDRTLVLRDDEIETRRHSATADQDQVMADGKTIGIGSMQAFAACGFPEDVK